MIFENCETRIARRAHGFTFVEVLIVMALIGILSVLAIPAFSSYRVKAYNAAAESDLKNFRLQMESHYAAEKIYPQS